MSPLLRRRFLAAALIAAAGLVGCASGGPVGSRSNPNAAVVGDAGFKLQGIRILWQDNPAFSSSLKYAVPRSTPNAAPPQALRKSTGERMTQILQVFRDEAVPSLTAALVEERVAPGSQHRIVLTPLSGIQDATGSGTGIVVRATVFDADNRVLWRSDIESHSGYQPFVGTTAHLDANYVKNFVSGLVSTMRKANLVGQA